MSNSTDSNWSEIEKIPVTTRGTFTFGDCAIELTNVEHHIWKNITKAELLEYYHSITDYMLPFLKARPLSLHLKPYFATGPGFYIKDMEGREPECSEIFRTKRKHKKAGKRDIIDYLVCNNESTLLYVINLGCIDVNPWNSRIENPDHPDYIVIDLDPSDEDFSKVVETALIAKEIFKLHRLRSFVKTSGKTGMHLLLPCTGFNFPEARLLAESICRDIHNAAMEITTIDVSVKHRGNKVYLDPAQNDPADTIAAVYSARPYKLPTVSTPLEWGEVNSNLDPSQFTIDTVPNRIEKKGDLWKELNSEEIKAQNTENLRQFFLK